MPLAIEPTAAAAMRENAGHAENFSRGKTEHQQSDDKDARGLPEVCKLPVWLVGLAFFLPGS